MYSPGYHFAVTVRPNWDKVLPIAYQRAVALGYGVPDPNSAWPFYMRAWFTGTNWADFEGGIRYDVYGGKTPDWQPDAIHILGAGRTSRLLVFRFGLRDLTLAQAHSSHDATDALGIDDLQLTFDCNGFGFESPTREERFRQVLARLPAWQTINYLWGVRLGTQELPVWREEDDQTWYKPLPWAPEFSIKSDRDIDTYIMQNEYVRLGVHIVPMIERTRE
jgi:hypothetical protein